MKRIFLLATCLGALLLAACGGDSQLPTPTGKGAVRMINAIPASPEINFYIEERLIGSVTYKNSSAPDQWDDFDYTFNFEVAFPGATSFTRIASVPLKVEADRDHIFMLSGDINAPTVTVIDGDIRTFDSAATVLEVRFAHGSETLGDIDVYFDPAGTALGTNPPVATLAFGEAAPPADYEAGDYVVTVTAANDVNTVLFTSRDTGLLAQFAHVITVFDADPNDTGPVAVRSMTSVGNPLSFADVAFPPKIRFIHSSFELESVDIYEDDTLLNQVVSDLPFQGATADIDTTVETKTYYFTPTGSTAQVLFEQEITSPAPGTFTHVYLVGATSSAVGVRLVPDRAPASTGAKLRIFHGAANYPVFDIFLVDRDAPVTEDDNALIISAAFALFTPSVTLETGSYDLYLAERNTRTTISPPFPVDLAVGGVVDLIAVDTVDPAVIELVDVPVP
jgi:hypothetical protein